MYNVNKNFFKRWSESMAYTLGYFCANGCLYKSPGGYYTIIFSTSDTTILEQIKQAMESDHVLHANGTQLRIGSQELGMQLEELLGFSSNKNRNMKFPTLEPRYLPHFLRGYFDGNGSFIVEQGRRIISSVTCPNEAFLEDLRDALTTLGLTRVNIHKIEDRGVTYMARYFVQDTMKLYEILYQRANIYSRPKRQHYDTGQKR